MVEKVITLENISLIDFLGIENQNIKQLAAAFPSSKIISRGNEIKIQGKTPEITKINEILTSLIDHYHKYGKITHTSVNRYLAPDLEGDEELIPTSPDIIIYGSRGNVIKAKTPNQKKLADAIEKNDLVFVLGPAGTGKTYLAMAMAVSEFLKGNVSRIILTRPARESGENLVFLPGSLEEKIMPYLRPLYDALYDCMPPEQVDRRIASGEIDAHKLKSLRLETM